MRFRSRMVLITNKLTTTRLPGGLVKYKQFIEDHISSHLNQTIDDKDLIWYILKRENVKSVDAICFFMLQLSYYISKN
jgi:hypothetical protein